MAFPTTGILDNFNRTENPVSNGGQWGGIVNNSAPSALQTGGSTMFSASSYGGATYINQAFQNLEGYFTRKDATADDYFYWRIVPGTQGASTTTLNCYMIHLPGGNTGIEIDRYDAGTSTNIFSAGSGATNNANDQWGITHDLNGLITAYLNGAGVATVTDNTYPNAGYFGFATNASADGTGIDQFGGGELAHPGGGLIPQFARIRYSG